MLSTIEELSHNSLAPIHDTGGNQRIMPVKVRTAFAHRQGYSLCSTISPNKIYHQQCNNITNHHQNHHRVNCITVNKLGILTITYKTNRNKIKAKAQGFKPHQQSRERTVSKERFHLGIQVPGNSINLKNTLQTCRGKNEKKMQPFHFEDVLKRTNPIAI